MPTRSASSPDHHPAVLRLKESVNRYVDRLGNIAAMVTVALPHAEPIQIAAGHADRERSIAVSPAHLYQAGSQTKTFTLIATLLLAKAGRLRMSDSVVQHLDFDIDPAITLEMLAMNTSGLAEYADLVFNPQFTGATQLAPEVLVRMALLKGQSYQPGLHFDYSNIGFVLLGLVVERVSGLPLASFVRRHVLEPLGLEDVCFGSVEPQPHERMARGYFASRSSGGVVDMSRVSLSWAFGTGDMVVSMQTMIRFGQALLDRNNAVGIHLQDLTARTAFGPYSPTNTALSLGVEYGYGLERCWWAGRPVWGHRGGTAGYNSGTWIDPELNVVVTTCVTTVRDFTEPEALTNARYPGPQFFTLALATAYALLDA